MLQDATPDAAESSAGDDFHILWTIHRCLKLINFDRNDLKAISVENLSNADTSYLDTSGGMSLGVDLTEYFGGTNFADSQKVIVSQLKYSTRTPDKEWTPARICTSRKGTVEGSIINRLALFYTKLSNQVDREKVLSKLMLKLVSNRPAAKKLTELISKIQNFCKSQSLQTVDLSQVKAALNDSEKQDLDRLINASKLEGSKFLDFISVLDFSDCNQSSRFELEQKIIASIASLTSFRSSPEYAFLHKLIWGKMQPEQRAMNTISLSDVLLAFGFHDISAIFPVKNEITRPENIVLREQLDAIKAEILNEDNKLICLHGGAGIGKSTLVNMIPDILPEQSISIIFDSYGGGSYLDPEDRRHKHSAGIIQLCNELSLKAGSDLLLNLIGPDEFFLRQLKSRISSAIKIIRKLNPSALLTVIIDAADNSVTAANVFDGTPFVKDIVRMEFAEGCRIIVSARTERVETLNLPSTTKLIRLLPFSYAETVAFLNGHFNGVTEDQVKEFRKLTHSNPRVMAYAVELPGKDLIEKMIPLKPNGKTLEQIFRLRVKEAEQKSSEKDVSAFLKNLIALPRPVPFDFIKHTTSLTDENLSDIRVDLWREVLEDRKEFTFRDEDFETYLRKTYKLDETDYIKIANALLERAEIDEYASTHLANFLSKAGMHAALKDIVIEKKYLSYPLDPVKNKEVFIERSKTALRNASIDFNPQDFIKLLIVSAEAAKTNKVLEDILFEKPDLAAKYGNLQTNQKIYFQSGNPSWFGRVHYRNAAIYSRIDETKDLAKQHLQKAKEWLDFRKKLNEDELEKYRLFAFDLAYGAEAVLHLYGSDKAISWIKSWKPKQALYDVIEILLKNLISLGDTSSVDRWLKKNSDELRIDVRLLIVQLYFLNGLKPPVDVNKILEDVWILERFKPKMGIEFLASIVAFCEYWLKSGLDYKKIKPVLELVQLVTPNYPPAFYDIEKDDLNILDLLLRKGIILHFFEGVSFTTKDFYSKSIQENFASKDHKIRSQVEDQVKRFERIYSHLLPAYHIRAGYFFKKTSPKTESKRIEDRLKGFVNDWELNYYQRHDAPGLQKFILLKIIDICFHQRGDAVVSLIKQQVINRDLKNTDLLLAICEKLSRKRRFNDSVIFMLGHIEVIIDSSNLPGRELVENYTRAAVTGSMCSLETGKYYFDKMVTASSEIDFEAFDQIRSIRDFTDDLPPQGNPDLAIKFFRYAEYCAERLRNWDGFPWHIVVPTLAKLDLRTTFAVVCQWDHRYVQATSKHYMELITAALEQDFIPVDIGAAMLAMNRYYYDGLMDYYKTLIQRIDDKKDHKLKNEALKQIIRDIQLHRPSRKNNTFLRNFQKLFQDGKFTDSTIIQNFEEYILKLEKIISQQEENSETIEFEKPNSDLYSEALCQFTAIDSTILKRIIEHLQPPNDRIFINFKKLFEEIASGANSLYYEVYLNALIEVQDQGVCYNDFESGLKIFLDAWKHDGKVKQWKSKAFSTIIQKWFSIFFYDDHISYDTLKRLSQILEIDETQFARSLIKMIPEELDEFSSSVLYQMLAIIYPLIEPSDRQITLDWMLNRWVDRVPEDFAPTIAVNLLKSGSVQEIIAHFFRYNLGHPKKKVRWITAHMLRRLVKFKNSEILVKLLELQNEQSCHPFQDQESPFYWISAKLYLWIALERISKEMPEILTPLSTYLIAEIQNQDLPHAQIKYFARSAAMSIIKFDPNVFSDKEKEEIEKSLSSPFEVITEKSALYPKDKKSKDLKFKFDTMDTLPYWYAPLGRVFNVGEYKVAELADKFITEHWGYVGDIYKDNHVRNADHNDTSNRHGSEPSIEDLSAYYEYHAMFCAATTLLNTTPLVVVEDSFRDTWDEWIEGWGLCWKDFWLSDFNEPTPLIKKYWVNNREGNSEWEWDIQKEDFDNVLGLDDEETVVIHLGATVNIGKDYESISLRSGIISGVTGRALLRLYQTRSASDNYINFENDTDYDDEIKRSIKEKNSEFTIHSWLFEEKTEVEGIDDNDPLFKNISKSRIRPGRLFSEWSSYKISDDFKYTYLKDEGISNWLSKLTTWSDTDNKSNYNDFTSGGKMLVIKRSVLKSFLQNLDKDLIVKVEINRSIERRDHKYYPPYSRIYLFKANGRIETISGDYKSW